MLGFAKPLLAGKTKKFRHFQFRNNISSDELNRLRHFHYYVDFKGRLWRQEIDKPGKLFGFIKEGDVRLFLFSDSTSYSMTSSKE